MVFKRYYNVYDFLLKGLFMYKGGREVSGFTGWELGVKVSVGRRGIGRSGGGGR